MNCLNLNCRLNPASGNEDPPCEDCLEKLREAKGRKGIPKKSIHKPKICGPCKRSFLKSQLNNVKSVLTCQSCLAKQKQVESSIEKNRLPDAKEVLFVMHFDKWGKSILYKSFFYNRQSSGSVHSTEKLYSSR